jgi:aspartyl-tRNA(Asn)/glutamyl-tRNA(Gln) amidotransferase subunit A
VVGDDILYLPLRELGRLLRTRKLSPVELTDSYLDRTARLGPKLNAYATVTLELARPLARTAETEIMNGRYRGPLHGIPYAPKDLVATKGAPTTWGAKPYANQTFDENATVIERLNDAGAIMIGKAAMIELAGGLGYTSGAASLTGPCRNPWNTDYWTCGSSSGSGAIVAAALAAFTLGSDTRGSIICPAAHCGITGLRPSFGRVSRHGAMAIAWTMDKIGPMARSADCCGLILSAIAGHDPLDHDSLPAALSSFTYDRAARGAKPLRIGRLTNVFPKATRAVHEASDRALRLLAGHGAIVEDAELPDGPFEEAAELVILMEAASSFSDLLQSGRCAELSDPHGQINGYASMEFSAVDYLRVQRVRALLQQRIDALFDRFDVIAAPGEGDTPISLSAPPESEETTEPIDSRQPDAISSLCGLPAITVPCGFTADALPLGMQFIGRALNDGAVIAAAHVFQMHTDWHLKRPPVDKAPAAAKRP